MGEEREEYKYLAGESNHGCEMTVCVLALLWVRFIIARLELVSFPF